ncbi:methyl-accepting chemotaxis protein [Maledivibacter halophilus]|uniref:Methyl-accepting chemotaxis protein n=1 Tax=Maledivibacter halophilus TaxID=36842 RepID=A0A1T5MPG4_9FIRM|nr:methyl-accepting chemotaxis protein [Maledivibacter halophilus]SKC90127.1 methyl-accepting chemotaxis protein [Maledivibacter halophilus]
MKRNYIINMIGIIVMIFITEIFFLSNIHNIFYKSGILSGIIIIVVTLNMIFYKIRLKKSIEILENFFEEYSKGNLLIGLDRSFKLYEFNRLEKLINETRNQMKNWLFNTLYAETHLSNVSEQLNQNSKECFLSMQMVSDNISNIANGSTKTSDDSNEIASISEELLSTNMNIADYSNNAKKFASESIEVIDSDSKIINKALDRVEEVEEIMRRASDHINTLGELLKSISKMSETISNIANQTNLLSLNASIEAARAGKEGKGFGVVADEIKKLAQQSAAASMEIAESTKEIQNNIKNVILVIDTGVTKSKHTREESKKAAENLANINLKISEMVELINNITESIEEQASASEVLTRNIEGIAKYAHDTDELSGNIQSRVVKQIKMLEENNEIANRIIEISNKFNKFIGVFEKEIEKELIYVCEILADIIIKEKMSNNFLADVSEKTGISEIYITNSSGVTIYSNNPKGIGFEFTNDPQTQAFDFYQILKNPELKITQKTMKRDIDNRYFKFVGVSRKDSRGIIQVGLSLEDILKFKGYKAIKKITTVA